MELEPKTTKSLFGTNEALNKHLSDNIGAINDAARTHINKTFVAGEGTDPSTRTDGGALRLYTLDSNVYNTTFSDEDFTIFKDLAHIPVNNTVVNYDVYNSHGRNGHSLFTDEISISPVNTPSLEQKTATMKFIVDVKQQSFAMQMVSSIEDPTKLLEMSGIADIAETVEWATFYGNEALAPEGHKGLEFNGLEQLIPEENHIDARGAELSPEMMNKAAVAVGKGFGVVSDAYMPIGVKAAFINEHLPAQRILQPNQAGEGMQVGFDIARFISARGDIALHGSTIMDMNNVLDESGDDISNMIAPATVKVAQDSATKAKFLAENVTNAKGKVTLEKDAGKDVSYKVVLVGRDGRSAASDAATVNVANATQANKLTITMQTLGSKLPEFVEIYRESSVPGDDRFFLIDRVPLTSKNTAGNVLTYEDTNATIPGTASVFLGENKRDTIFYMELAGISKFDLATVNTATQFGLLWYGCLALTKPKRWVEIHNVAYANA